MLSALFSQAGRRCIYDSAFIPNSKRRMYGSAILFQAVKEDCMALLYSSKRQENDVQVCCIIPNCKRRVYGSAVVFQTVRERCMDLLYYLKLSENDVWMCCIILKSKKDAWICCIIPNCKRMMFGCAVLFQTVREGCMDLLDYSKL